MTVIQKQGILYQYLFIFHFPLQNPVFQAVQESSLQDDYGFDDQENIQKNLYSHNTLRQYWSDPLVIFRSDIFTSNNYVDWFAPEDTKKFKDIQLLQFEKGEKQEYLKKFTIYCIKMLIFDMYEQFGFQKVQTELRKVIDNRIILNDVQLFNCNWKNFRINDLYQLYGHKNWVRSVCFSPDGNTLASGSVDNSIRQWDLKTGQQKAKLDGHMSIQYVSPLTEINQHRLVIISLFAYGMSQQPQKFYSRIIVIRKFQKKAIYSCSQTTLLWFTLIFWKAEFKNEIFLLFLEYYKQIIKVGFFQQ
ncbi:unnamed protein product [Paramecium primaurelia]|uniref:Uncharacterized protein n=1 Tax=Paramecium primaurelia TaxID=5886 RepID=A0A8S1QVL1_PARPR|nr:unnamed protein product [Paramecium primaurelia]